MNKFWKMLGDVEIFSAVFGWLFFSVLIMAGLSLISGIVSIDFFNELSTEIRVIMSLIMGYCVWYPYWDKRRRN